MKPFHGFQTPRTNCGRKRDALQSFAMTFPAAAADAPTALEGRP
jgi:hypothetical protein